MKTETKHYGKSCPKLTEAQVIEIRDRYKDTIISYVKLAGEYDVNLRTIFDVVQRRTWRHIPERIKGTYKDSQIEIRK